MKATINFENHIEVNVGVHRKENHFKEQYTLLHIQEGQIKEALTIRIYRTQATIWVCIWLHSHPFHYAGAHKASFYSNKIYATEKALEKMGITFDKDTNDIKDFMKAIAEALNLQNPFIHNAHQ